MAKLNIILLVISCVLTLCLGRRIPREITFKNSFTKFEIVKPEKSTIFGERCIHESSEGLKMLGKFCPRFSPMITYTEALNLVVLSKEFTAFSRDWYNKMKLASGLSEIHLMIELCNYMNHPNYTIDVIPSQIISHDQFCELSIITDNAEKEKSDSSDLEKSVVTRQICRMYASAEKIATVGHQQNNSELTKPQMPVLKSMREQGNCTFLLECEDPNYVSKICSFLNETVSHEDQAEKLGITVELYEKLVAARKLYSEKIDEGRLAQAKRSCEAIEGIESDGVNLSYWRNALALRREKMQQFNELWLEYSKAADSDKISTLLDVCKFMGFEKPMTKLGVLHDILSKFEDL